MEDTEVVAQRFHRRRGPDKALGPSRSDRGEFRQEATQGLLSHIEEEAGRLFKIGPNRLNECGADVPVDEPVIE